MQRYVRSTDSDAVEFDQEWIILHPDQFTVTKVNEVGGICWSLLHEPQTVQSLAGHITEQYDITGQEAEQDVGQFLQRMKEIGLIRHAG
jgi:hypothetical protein